MTEYRLYIWRSGSKNPPDRATALAGSEKEIKTNIGAKLEQKGYICAEHAKPFIQLAVANRLFIGVRKTGSDSLVRLGKGAACKPHFILEKSLKKGSIEKSAEALNEAFEGIVDLSTLSSDAPPSVETLEQIKKDGEVDSLTLRPRERHRRELKREFGEKKFPTAEEATGISSFAEAVDKAVLKESKPQEVKVVKEDQIKLLVGYAIEKLRKGAGPNYKGCVGWWFNLIVEYREDSKKEPKIVPVPMGVLKVGAYNESFRESSKEGGPEPAEEYGVPVSFAELATSGIPLDVYTGDYDLHCLFRVIGRGETTTVLPVESTPARPESAAATEKPANPKIIGLHRDYLGPEDCQKILNKFNKELCVRKRNKVKGNNQHVEENDRYAALIQHGAQNLFLPYVMQHNREKVRIVENELKRELGELKKLGSIEQVSENEKAKEIFEKVGANKIVENLCGIDPDGVIGFTPDGNVYILPDGKTVEAYYNHFKIGGSFSKNLLWNRHKQRVIKRTRKLAESKEEERKKEAELKKLREEEKEKTRSAKKVSATICPDGRASIVTNLRDSIYAARGAVSEVQEGTLARAKQGVRGS